MTELTPIVVSGPAKPETLALLRAVAASVAARCGLTYDRIEELRMAVDEAATLVLQASSAGELSLELDLTDPRAFVVRVFADGDGAAWPGDRARSWAWRVIDQLGSDAAMHRSATGSPEVIFRWIVDPPGPSGGPGG